MKIAILGGTGKEGAGLGRRWAAAGHEIIIGSRSPERAEQTAEEMRALLPDAMVRGLDNVAAVDAAEVVVLAVPYDGQADTLAAVGGGLQGKLLISVVAPLKPPVGRVWRPDGGSAAEEAQQQLGDNVRVVAAFQSISAEHLKDLEHTIDSDVLVCGDKRADREIAVQLASDAGMRGIHAGPLPNAAVAEGLAAVMIAINKRYDIKNAGIRVTGIGEA